jgi:hypothetical protein
MQVAVLVPQVAYTEHVASRCSLVQQCRANRVALGPEFLSTVLTFSDGVFMPVMEVVDKLSWK